MDKEEIELTVKFKQMVKDAGFRLRNLEFTEESTGKLGVYREVITLEAVKGEEEDD